LENLDHLEEEECLALMDLLVQRVKLETVVSLVFQVQREDMVMLEDLDPLGYRG